MTTQIITKEQAINHPVSEYNPSAWKETVERYAKYANAEFFQNVDASDIYNQLFVRYTIAEGITFFARLTYSSCISNGGFYQVLFARLSDGIVKISTRGFGEDGKAAINTSKEARAWMSKTGATFTKDSF